MAEKSMPKGGWVCVYRSLLTSEIWGDHNLTRVFLWCLLKANHKPRTWKGQLVQRGEFVTSTVKAAGEIGLSRSVIVRAFKRLERAQMVTTRAVQRATHVSICNYDTYQQPNQRRGTTRGTSAVQERYVGGTSAVQARYISGHKQQGTSNNPSPELNRGATPAIATDSIPDPTQTPPAPTAAPPIPPPPPAGRHVEDNPGWFNIPCSTPWAPPDEPPPPEPRYVVEPFDGPIVPGGIIPAYDHHRLGMSRWLGEIDQNYFREVKALSNHVVEPLPVPRSCDPGSVFQWLRPEHLLEGPKGALNVARWFRSQLAAEAPVFMAHQADLLFALCCHKQLGASGGHIRNRVGYFARLCTTQTKAGWTPMARHAKRLVVETPKIYRQTIEERRPT